MEYIKIFIFCLGYFLFFITVLPFIRLDYWFFRVFEYPRIQKLFISLLIITVYTALYELSERHDYLFSGLLLLNISYLSFQVFPFTSLAKKQLTQTKEYTPEKAIALFIGNVYQFNRQGDEYIESIKKTDPDLILLVETDSWWADKAAAFKETHPYKLLVPLENTYGMLLYSKFELVDRQIKYLVEDDVPSVHTCIKLPSGDLIRFHGLHPTPPVPGENPRSTERDKEILMVGKTAKKSELPVIVAGDLNDVAWSYSTLLFSKISGLLDPRVGRGFFNTFHAKHWFMRFPLDHIFCSTDFTLLDIKRMPNCGSDHFPMYIKLQYDPKAAGVHDEPEPNQDDLKTANRKINKTV